MKTFLHKQPKSGSAAFTGHSTESITKTRSNKHLISTLILACSLALPAQSAFAEDVSTYEDFIDAVQREVSSIVLGASFDATDNLGAPVNGATIDGGRFSINGLGDTTITIGEVTVNDDGFLTRNDTIAKTGSYGFLVQRDRSLIIQNFGTKGDDSTEDFIILQELLKILVMVEAPILMVG